MTIPKGLSDLELNRGTAGWWDRRRRERERRRALELFQRSRRIGERSLAAEFPGISECEALIQGALERATVLGNVTAFELIVLAMLCRYLKPALVVEFGTFIGLTTLQLALNSPNGAKVVTIDWAADDPRRQAYNDDTYYTRGTRVGEAFLGTAAATKIEQLYLDSADFDPTPYRGRAGLVFVDGGHDYAVVRADSEKALAMVERGGVIVWHDYVYSHYGAYTWLNELAATLPLFTLANTTMVCYHAV